MFGSIYVGLSGLGAYSRGLQQVSNNVTNMNSLGFKAQTVSFTDIVSLSGNGLSYSGGGEGGGNGVGLGDTTRDFRPGELRQTERDLDLAIDGSGFLMLLDGTESYYTRTGSFEVNEDGFIVLAGTDNRLATLDEAGRPVSHSVDAFRTNPPMATTTVKLADNLSSTGTSHTLSDIKVYDPSGGEHVWQVKFTKNTEAGADQWTVKVTDEKDHTVGTQALKFIQGSVDPATNKLVFSDTASGLSVTLDLSQGVTSFSSGQVSTLRSSSVDGYGTGVITSVRVNADGRLEILYSNEQTRDLGAVAIADFRDPQALEERGGGLFVQEAGTHRDLMASEDVRIGRVVSKRLEASNVDLAKQFGELILIQRGFQASSQIISVSNDMLQQLFGMRGQG